MTTESERTLTNVPGLPEGSVVVIKKLGYASLSRLRSRSVDAKITTDAKAMDAKLDMGAYHKYILIYGIKSAPFFAACVTIQDREAEFERDLIPAQAGEFLFNEIQKFNGFAESDAIKKE